MPGNAETPSSRSVAAPTAGHGGVATSSPSAPSVDGQTAPPLVRIADLKKYYPIRGGLFYRAIGYVRAVDGVSLSISSGETLGLVGESGCGKTTLGRCALRLIPATSGSVTFDGQDVLAADGKTLQALRRQMQIIFQDPFGSLDPRMPVGEQIGEVLLTHGLRDAGARDRTVRDLFERVGLQRRHISRYPHEFSGGQRQRIGIARALALRPKFIVCDEPVSALDVSIQSQILNLLKDLQREFGLTYLFIAHNLAVVEHISDRVAVLYLGKLAELADAETLYRDPHHPYTRALLSAVPVPDPTLRRRRIVLKGDLPSPANPPSGCRFHTRCPLAIARCREEEPALRQTAPGHWTACHLAPGGG